MISLITVLIASEGQSHKNEAIGVCVSTFNPRDPAQASHSSGKHLTRELHLTNLCILRAFGHVVCFYFCFFYFFLYFEYIYKVCLLMRCGMLFHWMNPACINQIQHAFAHSSSALPRLWLTRPHTPFHFLASIRV